MARILTPWNRHWPHTRPNFSILFPIFKIHLARPAPLEKRKKLVSLAEEKHNFWLIEDAPYRPLRYRGQPIRPCLNSARSAPFMLSFSKLIGSGPHLQILYGNVEVLKRNYEDCGRYLS